jgi:DNA repair exonuclease SbcCD nuclease subunit
MTNLFKKAAVFTDLHLGMRNNSDVHNEDCMDFIDWFIATAKEQGCETCFFLGDYHHHRSAVNLKTLQYSIRGIEKLSANFEHVYFIAGNHDTFFRHSREVHVVEWARHLTNVTVIDKWFERDGVVIAPWLVGEEYKEMSAKKGRYLFGHFELPHFLLNAMIAAPDHGELQTEHVSHFDYVFSGHFHKRQRKDNVIYIGNAFPHNFSDVNDDDRGMMILEWDCVPEFKAWPDAPKFRVYNLSALLAKPEELLFAKSHVKVNIDVDLSFEESAFLRESLIPQFNLREMTLIPQKADLETDNTDYTNSTFESVDTIVHKQIEELEEGAFDRKLLLEIYRSV